MKKFAVFITLVVIFVFGICYSYNRYTKISQNMQESTSRAYIDFMKGENDVKMLTYENFVKSDYIQQKLDSWALNIQLEMTNSLPVSVPYQVPPIYAVLFHDYDDGVFTRMTTRYITQPKYENDSIRTTAHYDIVSIILDIEYADIQNEDTTYYLSEDGVERRYIHQVGETGEYLQYVVDRAGNKNYITRIVRNEKPFKYIHEIIDNLIIDSINVVWEMYDDVLKTNGHKNTDIYVCLIDTEYISENIYKTPIDINVPVDGYLIQNYQPNYFALNLSVQYRDDSKQNEVFQNSQTNNFTESVQAREGSIWNVIFNNILNDSYDYTPNIKILFADPSFKETLKKNNLMGMVMYPIFSTDGEMFGFIFQPIYNIYTFSFRFIYPELFDHVPYQIIITPDTLKGYPMGMDTIYSGITMFVDMELCKHCRDDVDVDDIDDMLTALYMSYIRDITKYAYVYKHGMADGTIQTIFKTTKHYK